jgi:hypothetical protein
VLDLLGSGFTLLRTDRSADLKPWVWAAGETGVPLAVVDLPDDLLAEHADRYPAALLLVRPDQHVAWMGGADALPDQLLHTATGRVTAHQR